MKERIRWIDVAKGIATILVVSGHVWGGYTGNYAVPKYQNLIDYVVWIVYTFHMALFFALSGYVYALAKKSVSNRNDYRVLIKRKARALMIPYFIAGIITILIKIPFSGSIANGYSWTNIVLLPIKPVEQLWFLYVLFLCFCVKGFCEWKKINCYIIPIIMLLMGTFISTCGGEAINYWLSVGISLLSNYIYFYMGYKLFDFKFDTSIPLCLLVAVSFVILSTCAYCFDLNKGVYMTARILLAFSGSIIVFYISSKIGLVANSKILNCIGKFSMIIYLIHPLLCSILRRGMYAVGVNNFVIHILIGTILGVAIPIIIEVLFKITLMRLKNLLARK